MTHATDYLENALLDFTLRNVVLASPAALYLALFSAFTEGGTQTELAGSNYARQAVTFDAPASGSISNAAAVDFPTAADAWGTATHVGLCDAASGGNVLFWAALDAPRSIDAGKTFSVEAGELVITLSGDLSVALRDGLLNHLCRNTAYTPAATVYGALLSAFTDDGDYAELVGSAYARVALPLDAASAGVADNPTAVLFPEATGAWTAATHLAVFDASAGGDLLYRGALDAPVSVAAGETFRFAPGQLTFALD